MIFTPAHIETGEHVDAEAEHHEVIATWRDGLPELGPLCAMEKDLLEQFEDLLGKRIEIPKLRIVIVHPEKFAAAHGEVDPGLIEQAIHDYLCAKLDGDTTAQSSLDAIGPEGKTKDAEGFYLEFVGEPTVSDQAPSGGGSPTA